MKKPLTIDEYMSARAISDPIHLFDCVMPCAGAEAFLVCREDAANGQGLPAARLLATIERHNAFPDDPIQYRGGWAMDVPELYAMAGVTTDDVDFVQTYDDDRVCMMQNGRPGLRARARARLRPLPPLTADGSFPHNTSGQLSVAWRGGRRLLGLVEAVRQVTAARWCRRPDAAIGLVSGRHGHLRSWSGERCRVAGGRPRMTSLATPSARTRSKDARAAAAAGRAQPHGAWPHIGRREGRFQLQVCSDCGTVVYPPRDAGPALPCRRGCRSRTSPTAGTLLAETTIRTSTDVFSASACRGGIGTACAGCGPSTVAHLHGDLGEGERARLQLKIDKSGRRSPCLASVRHAQQADDPQWRELTCDPKYRRVLITDGRPPSARPWPRPCRRRVPAWSSRRRDPWKPFPGEERLRKIERVEIVALDLTDTISVNECAGEFAARVDILINTAEYYATAASSTARADGGARRAGDALLRPDAARQGVRAVLRARAPRRNSARVREPLSVYALVNVAGLWRLLGDRGCLPSAAAIAARRAATGGVQVVNAFFGPLLDRMVSGVAAAQVAPSALAAPSCARCKKGLEDVSSATAPRTSVRGSAAIPSRSSASSLMSRSTSDRLLPIFGFSTAPSPR